MRIVLYRPSPRAAGFCFENSTIVLNHLRKQMESGVVSITWVFLLTLNTTLNALWATSYAEVRQAQPRDDVEELVNMSLLCLERCAER